MLEQVVNSRPLCRASHNSEDMTPITPAHLLNLSEQAPLIDGDVNEASTYTRSWKQMEHLQREFYERCICKRREKWTSEKRDLRVGELVIMLKFHTHRLRWPLGLIQDVYPGKDRHMRSVLVTTLKGTYKRQITKMVSLECEQ